MPEPVTIPPQPSRSVQPSRAGRAPSGRRPARWLLHLPAGTRRDLVIVFVWALGLRLLFAALTSNTYDPDEFVLLTLARAFSHGAVPYRDFIFFHPPGVLVLLSAVQPSVALWWPAARIFMMLADTCTALLTWRIGRVVYGDRGGLAAGMVYGISPLALITSARVGQDTLMTTLGVAGLALLLTRRSPWAALAAGLCLALATWIKYPGLLFLPVYLLAAPRRFPMVTAGTFLAGALLFAPFAPMFHQLVHQTVLWQRGRPATPLDFRVERLAIFWLGLNALAIPGLLLRRPPAWLGMGFILGGAFLFAPQVYDHYLVPIVPFAALLAAPVLLRLPGMMRPAVVAAGIAVTVVSGLIVAGANPTVNQFVSAARFSDIRPIVAFLDRSTRPGSPILSDRPEYAYLANRPIALNYFWNVKDLVTAGFLQRHIGSVKVVVVTAGPSGFPRGFIPLLRGDGLAARPLGPDIVWSRPGSAVRTEADPARS